MGILVQFPQDRRIERSAPRSDASQSGVVLILPVIRIERSPDRPGSEPASDAGGRKRRRRVSRG